MLPYHLRPPSVGRTLKSGTQSEVQAGGGPVQRAIQKDLEALHREFLADVARRQQQQGQSTKSDTKTAASPHWKRGESFGLFKHVFGSYKTALVHLLIPSAKCDEEAYSQLIYAGCLDVFKQSMKDASSDDTSSYLDKSIAAVFSLYALYQTNPLPRSTKSPWENLTMGLHSLENPRTIYRRAFTQKIRIDRLHYNLLLRLRELALARQAQCSYSYHSGKEEWACTCGIASDVLDVLERMDSHLDFAYYTGPVGLEGIAGHADWQDETAEVEAKEKPPTLLPLEGLQEAPFEISSSTSLATNLQNYQSRIKAIQLPNEKSHMATRLHNELTPFFESLQKEPWEQVQYHLFNENPTSNISSTGPRRRVRRVLNVRIEVPEQETGGEKRTGGVDEDEDKTETLPKFELIMSDDIPQNMENHLERAVTSLLEQNKDLLTDIVAAEVNSNSEEQPCNPNQSVHHGDEVSSIGIGGVSVVTGQGRMALQQLLSSTAKLPRVATIPKPSKTQQRPMDTQKKNQAARFLSLTEENMVDSLSNEASDDGSVVSNLSFPEDDEDDDYDGASAATSAVGRHALETLLQEVQTGKKRELKKSQAAERTTKKQRVSLKNQSTSSSIGPGKAAINSLLKKPPTTTTTRKKNAASAKRRTPTRRVQAIDEDIRDDEGQSVASSLGPGRLALHALLQKAATTKTTKTKIASSTKKKTLKKRVQAQAQDKESQNEEDPSVASSLGPGKTALGALLSQAEQKSSRRTITRRKKTRAGSEKQLPEWPDFCDDNQSTISSIGPGEQALDALLNKASGRSTGLKKPSPTTPKHVENENGDEVDIQSLASSVGPGTAALTSLLKNATKSSPHSKKKSRLDAG